MTLRHSLFGVLLVLSACSGSASSDQSLANDSSNEEQPSESAIDEVESDDSPATTAPETTALETTASSTEPVSQGDDPSPESSSATVAPLTPAGDPPPVDDSDNADEAWISRRSMSADSIELTWAAPEGASSYEIHRLSASDSPPAESEMTAETQIHSTGNEGRSGRFTDSDVDEGAKYWYGVRGVDEAGETVSTGWHRADAVTDDEPPSSVEPTLSVENGTVFLEWAAPDENYALHGYRVLRTLDGEEPELVATTWNLDQRSFSDDEPPQATVSYSVVAFDFHWNDAEPSPVAVDLS